MELNQVLDGEDLGEDTVRFFIWSVWNFFKSTTNVEPEVGTPYLFNKFKHSDYTGIIGVSGSQKGAVYVTMEKDLLDEALAHSYPNALSEESMEEMRVDYSGEIANIISGNVRNYLGEQFLISVPVVVTAPATEMHITMESKGIVFPVKWKGYTCHIVLCLEKNDTESDVSYDKLGNVI